MYPASGFQIELTKSLGLGQEDFTVLHHTKQWEPALLVLLPTPEDC
jgi:hypothetical protein